MKKVILLLSAFVTVLLSCSKENTKKIEVSPTSITVYAEGTTQITTNVEDATYKSNDEFYAKVDANGLVTGNKVGSTDIVVSSSYGSVTIPITIMSKYSLYPDLDPLIGKGTSEMTKLLGSNYTTSTATSGATNYTYVNPTSYAAGIALSMKGGKCESIGVLVPTTNTSMLTKHLLERYSVAGMQNDFYFFLNHDKNVVIALQVYNVSYLMALYMPYTKSESFGSFDFSIPEDLVF